MNLIKKTHYGLIHLQKIDNHRRGLNLMRLQAEVGPKKRRNYIMNKEGTKF
jgi:hypothetical protein